MSPLGTGILLAGLAGAIGGIWGGLSTGTGGIVGGIQQGLDLGAAGGMIVGFLSPEARDGAFAVAGVGLLSTLAISMVTQASAALAPKPAGA